MRRPGMRVILARREGRELAKRRRERAKAPAVPGNLLLRIKDAAQSHRLPGTGAALADAWNRAAPQTNE